MQHHDDTDSTEEVIHKEKKQKKTTDNRSIVSSLSDISSIVQGSTTVKRLSEQIDDQQNRHKLAGQKKLRQAEKNRRVMRNAEIDESLQGWLLEGLVNPSYASWVAKCCHQLGLERVNQLSINARNGKQPQRLFSTLLSANIKLKAKRDYYAITDTNADTAQSMREDLN